MEPLLTTKLYIPPARSDLVPRRRLIERLNAGLRSGRKLTLISAPAGYGKTTLIAEWVEGSSNSQQHSIFNFQPVFAWLSLDEGDNEPARFLAYLVAALQSLARSGVEEMGADFGKGVLRALQSPQPAPTETILTALVNEISTIPDAFVLVLDDYHVIDSQEIDHALAFLLEHLPPQMHLVIASRIDPSLPLSRLRAGGQMTELREDDLRFSPDETSTFLDKVMGLKLSAENLTALEMRTEGWIAGLKLAALSMQGFKRNEEIDDFVDRLTGSDRYIQDYLADEVLRQRPKGTEDFLLQTSILNRLSGPLCDAVRFGKAKPPGSSEGTVIAGQKRSQAVLEDLEAANLFIVPLDNQRRWYRYHHLFADLLRQRLQQQQPDSVAKLHVRASEWYEVNGLAVEAFQHAVAANDIERAARLVEGEGMPLQFRGAVAPVLNWLASLPATVLDARPSLWVMYASALSMTGQLTGVEGKLQAAEAALQGAQPDAKTRNLIGHIAAIRALMAAAERQVETIIAQSQRALEHLHPDNLPVRTATIWKLGIAYQLRGDRAAASQAYTEAIAISQASGNTIINLSATTGLGQVQESETQLHPAAENYRRALQLAGDPPLPAACEAYLGLARVLYEWNDLDAAQEHGQQSFQLARQVESSDWLVGCQVFLARLKLAQGDVDGAAAMLAEADQMVRQHNFAHRIPEVAAAQVLVLLRQGDLEGAAHLAQAHELPISQARVRLAQGNPSEALASLKPFRQQVESKRWQDERLKVLVLQAIAHHAVALRANGEKEQAVQLLADALALAQPGGYMRIFLDEEEPMRLLILDFAQSARLGRLWIEKQSPGRDHKLIAYVDNLLAAFARAAEMPRSIISNRPNEVRDKTEMVEPLSQRELEVLQLVAQGLSNREIGERLFLALNTVKGHNRKIFGKLEVKRRTEAVRRARELGLL